MLSKAKIKFVKSLQIKKYRKQEQCFTVEGAKSVQELLGSDFEVVSLFGSDEFLSGNDVGRAGEVIRVSPAELEDLGEFHSNNAVLAVARMKDNSELQIGPSEFAIALDDIRDPGNLGTIIRTADWYGVTKIIASEETADFYNSKVIHATMGSFTRVQVHYTGLAQYLQRFSPRTFGAYLDGEDVHHKEFGDHGIVLIGNEARGISPALLPFITDKVTIPRFGKAESLNAAIATAIICDNIRNR